MRDSHARLVGCGSAEPPSILPSRHMLINQKTFGRPATEKPYPRAAALDCMAPLAPGDRARHPGHRAVRVPNRRLDVF